MDRFLIRKDNNYYIVYFGFIIKISEEEYIYMKEKLKIPEKTEEEIDINDFKFLEI
jgi:hypothetical protein